MRERHNWGTDKHPKTCTCSDCTRLRAQDALPRAKKKRKPKSQRGKGKKPENTSVFAEAMDILNKSIDDANRKPPRETQSGDDV